jgi:hypothetical protein
VPITRPPNCAPGIGRLTEPVARMIVLAEIVSPLTVTAPSPASEPSPSITSILFFFISAATPPVSVEMTFVRRAETPA